jgi:hypothetical protein
MKYIFSTFIIMAFSVVLCQKSECSWFYDLKDNGFDEVTRKVSAVPESTFGPDIEIISWPEDPKYKGVYGLTFSWVLNSPPQLFGGDKDIIQASIKVNGVNKKYSFTTKYNSYKSNAGYVVVQLHVIGGATKQFLNDLKVGTELNVVTNYGQSGIQSSIFKYKMNCSSASISKLLAP